MIKRIPFEENMNFNLTIKDVVLKFNETAMYEITEETEDFYIIKDLQCNEIIKTLKKEWYEKIMVYLLEELLNDKRTLEELSYKEIAYIYMQLDVLNRCLLDA